MKLTKEVYFLIPSQNEKFIQIFCKFLAILECKDKINWSIFLKCYSLLLQFLHDCLGEKLKGCFNKSLSNRISKLVHISLPIL